jgi:hypothetical protein
LITLAVKRGVRELQVYGHSSVVINWMTGRFRIGNMTLLPILEKGVVSGITFRKDLFPPLV